MLEHVTPSVANDLLRRHGLRAGHRYGQHFLVDPNTVRRIVRLADIGRGETIVEIGPGLGSLTVALAQNAKHVITVEIDENVAAALREVVDGAPNVEIVVADAMRVDLGCLCPGSVRLVANLPYNVATPILMRVLDEVPAVRGGLVMVQREVGERWTAGPGSRTYGATSVHVAYHADARIAGEVPRTVFLPPPKVASVLVEFTRRDEPLVDVSDPGRFLGFVRLAFAHRRKTLRNSLMVGGFDRVSVETALIACGIDPHARPEDLALTDFGQLFASLGSGAQV